ncbi:hypothetical protein C5Y93_10000 [Blastopirellula marina]|uniref:SseB protein N-terminal domain-containing protein n=1 Tax=Blastopirellula marina TaxID=124 RepID=A0A2S8GPF7_9BACT|nr:hypothetical protein C5Y93_10000 [Blastopirellula marina]
METVLQEAMQADKKIDDFFALFLESDVTLASTTEVQPDGSELKPLLFHLSNDTWLCVFTALERAIPFKKEAPYCVTMKGRALLEWYPFPHGMIVNPGSAGAFELPLTGVRQLQKHFLGKDEGE